MKRPSAYQRKRDFTQTPEPDGASRVQFNDQLPAGTDGRFVIQQHHARSLHWDLRLEMDGTLRSWAVPKGVPERVGVKRLAVATEDHPLAYLHFAGEIPSGQYGAGRVLIYDQGYYRLLAQATRRLDVLLLGRVIEGRYMLVQMQDENWLLWKRKLPLPDSTMI